MDDMQVGFLAFLGVLELAMLAIAASVVFLLRSNRLSRKVSALEKKLEQSTEVPEAIGFDQYLRDEILRNEALTEQAAAAEDESEKKAAELLKFRKRFLEIELEAHALEDNPVAYQDKIAAGMCELVEIMRPEAETVETVVETDSDAAVELEEAPDDDVDDDRKTIDTSDAEMNHLKDVINNQQDAMAALRAQLEAHGEIEGIDGILKQLEDFEKQSAELERCLLMLETENERLKASQGTGEATKIEPSDPAQLTGLRNMVGNQQDTIGGLRKLINELMPEADKAGELEDTLDSIQRNNKELSGCVSVLEDENNMLRNELKQIETQLEEADAAQAEKTPTPHSEQIEEMEIKVQELEALVEFKDATIEELEKQYHTLEVKYREATGEQGA
ncbi:hypothetical protein MNBD_GAMMA15-391 [hydrothermal vent metagenome]|uniref:Uncharacterized protein n=1 Tax=hydrothermal vent metagenome TaxID=652676 RepID=A0A3B0YSB1_9ZZZZ